MNETLTRAISGFVYIAILIAAIYTSQVAFAILFLFFTIISCWEFNRLINLKSIRPYIQIVIGAILVYLTIFQKDNLSNRLFITLAIITLTMHLFLTYKLFRLQKLNDKSLLSSQLPLLYLIIPFILLTLSPSVINNIYNPNIIFGVLVIIWSNDTFAYLVGRKFGKHKLFEKVSPKKTIEGFLGGLIFGMIAAAILSETTESLSIIKWLILSIIIAISGAIGDLIASKFKREANIKDSSNLIPGHGGFLDRLDSLIFVSSFVYLYLQIINYVS